jgi:hypothetical protein
MFMSKLTLRAAQLDLARQMETPQYIRNFIDFVARCGYNAVMLYLEDRIRTASYPYPSTAESYSEEQIRELVEYARQKGIDLFPCVATLGHAERFLRHPELQHLAELQGDMKGRFGGTRKDSFCPTHPEFYDFIGRYLQEVAALFPSPYFHAGLDEFWDFNLCPRCQKAAPDLLAEEKLFLRHIQIIHELLKKAGKRMMMWSDMFENYTHIMQDVPSDVIMMDWQYQQDVRSYQGHLLDIGEEDRIAVNEKYGFETIIAPADRSIGNIRSYIEYVENRKVLGCMLTSWEKSDTFLYRTFPIFGYAGFLMNGKSDQEAFQAMMQELFGNQDELFSEGIKQAMTSGFWRHFSSFSESRLFTRDFFGLPYAAMQTDELLDSLLRQYLPGISNELGRIVCEDMLVALREKILSHRLKKLFHDSLDRGLTSERKAAIEQTFAEGEQLLLQLEKEWEKKRPGITPNVFTQAKPGLLKKLSQQLRMLEVGAFLRLRSCTPDEFIVQPISISLCCKGQWHEVACGNYKANDTETALFERFIPFDPKLGVPEAIRLELSGLGGRGLCYVEVRQPDGRVLVPAAITAVTGIVEHPEYMLENDVNWAWFGKQSSREAYLNPVLVSLKHSVTLTLKERSF